MSKPRWWLALPLALGPWALPAAASEVRDPAGIFSAAAVRQAQADLDRIEREQKVPVTIETISSLKEATSDDEKAKWKSMPAKKVIDLVAQRNAREGSRRGLYILLDKKEHVVSNLEIPERLQNRLPESKRLAVRDAFIQEFKNQNFDAGLSRAVKVIDDELRASQPAAARAAQSAPVAAPARNVPAPEHRGGGGLMTLIPIVLIIVAILIAVRVLGALFRGSGGGYGGGPGRMGGPGYGGGGPGYGGGGGGYGGGGGGGGFFSNIMGGIGGAMAGNWLYDQFSGRHGHDQAGTYGGGAAAGGVAGPEQVAQGGDDMIGANDDGSQGASWGGDTGGDWAGGGGGTDTGGGGDWGGGGGDTGGGGGGDWGGGGGDTGGGGGGDWGGGGGGDGGGGGGGDW